MKIRSGITLVEVLVAIFIMGVGLLAILVLFPVGALNMARAIRDDRAQQCGQQAAAIANMWDLRHNPAVTSSVRTGALDTAPSGYATPANDSASFPVLIDPFGAPVLGSPLGDLAGVTPGLRRVLPSVGSGVGQIPDPPGHSVGERWFMMQDDIEFQPDGTPTNPLRRYGSFSWTYIARRSQHRSNLVDLTVLVYKGRPVLAPSDEPTFACAGTAGATSLDVTITGDPELRPLGYILDTSMVQAGSTQTVAAQAYQVMDIQKNGNTWTLRVEPPLRNAVNTVVFLEGVIAVFEKGTGWQP